MGLFAGLVLLLFILACSSVLFWRGFKALGSPQEFSQLQESFDAMAAHLAVLEELKELRDQVTSSEDTPRTEPEPEA